jgi:hypothetical protein
VRDDNQLHEKKDAPKARENPVLVFEGGIVIDFGQFILKNGTFEIKVYQK